MQHYYKKYVLKHTNLLTGIPLNLLINCKAFEIDSDLLIKREKDRYGSLHNFM